MQSLFQPQADELIDFGLAQLITDTNDIRSCIRGHSLARDMYGNDATGNAICRTARPRGWLSRSPRRTATTVANQYILTTNIHTNDSNFYGYNFTRWIMRVAYTGNRINGGTGVVNQTFEILIRRRHANVSRQFTVLINSDLDCQRAAALDPTRRPRWSRTQLPGPYGSRTQLPGIHRTLPAANSTVLAVQPGRPLAARVQRPGHARSSRRLSHDDGLPASYYGNFRFTGPYLATLTTRPDLPA